MKVNEAHMRVVLQQLMMWEGRMNRQEFEARLLEECRRRRRDTDKAEHAAKGINIFTKREVPAKKLLDFCMKNEWVAEKSGALVLTEWGNERYVRVLTDNYSPAYQAYKAAVETAVDKERRIRPCLRSIQSAFGNGKPLDAFIADFLEPNTVGERSKAYQLSVLNDLGYSGEQLEGRQVFQLFPELFLPEGDVEEKVTLTIYGVKEPLNLVITRPYPNQRYAVAGLMVGRNITNVGFYPLILPKDQFPDKLDLELIWTVGEGDYSYTVTHQMELTFDKEPDTGEFYSTCQRLVHSTDMPGFSLISYTPDDSKHFKGRDVRFIGKDIWSYHMVEKAVLSPFRMAESTGRSSSADYQRFLNDYKWIERANGLF